MSGPPMGTPGTPGPASAGNGPPGGNMALPPQQHQAATQPAGPAVAPPPPPPPANLSQQNLNSIVIEYLSKKGYSRTEAMLRLESQNVDKDGRPLFQRAEDSGGDKYARAFVLTRVWIEQNLEIYKPELKRLLWPLFVYSFLNLAEEHYERDCEKFFQAFEDVLMPEHEEDLRKLSFIRLPEHAESSEIAKIYRGNKYRVTLSSAAYFNLIQFLESKEKEGGAVIIRILQEHCTVIARERGAAEPHSLAALLNKATQETDMPAEDEGIPGHKPGSAKTGASAASDLPRLKLGPLPMEAELMGDVQMEAEEYDASNPPEAGVNSLVEEFRIKRETSEEGPAQNEVPLPPSLARDVAMEVQKLKENRDRFKIEGKTGGIGLGVSVTMFTFHNTHDSINCLDFSEDNYLVAAGMDESYIRVWSLDGRALKSIVEPGPNDPPPSASRRLIGHSGPIYAVSFSPSIATPEAEGDPTKAQTGPRYLLSSSADKSVRMWSVDAWACLVVYKGHDEPVWDVKWGPWGHYFLTGGHDKTARLWSTDKISYLRMFAGHDQDVDTVAFHPNSAYVFTGSSDRTVRMWSVSTGTAVRLFTGHTGNLTSMSCSPDGKTLASADDAGSILLWDLQTGRRLKRMRGHGKGGIWSVSWSVESTVLVSGGADGTVRIWDVAVANDNSGPQSKIIGEGGAGTKIDGGGVGGATGTAPGGKKKGKEMVITADQISAFPTKKSPVYKVRFTRQNLVVAGGAYLP